MTGDDGAFRLCGVPSGATVLARVVAEADTGAFVELEMPDDGVLVRPLYLGPRRVRGAGAEAGAQLGGIVESQYGEPLAGVRVRLWGTPYETQTSAEGAFAFAHLPSGSHTLEARAIGFVPLRLAVDLFPDRDVRANLVMEGFPTVIDTVKVLAMRPRSLTSPLGFEERRRRGYGTFLDADEIERRNPQVFTDLLRSTRGVQVTPGSTSGEAVAMEGNSPLSACQPLLVLDGMRVPLQGMSLNDLIPPHIVRAVEVYPRRLEAPPEYQTIECGTIVVWTGARGWLARRTTGPRFIKPKKKK